jgi:hypothetical protein
MKAKIMITNGEKFIVDLEANGIMSYTLFDDSIEFTSNKVLKTVEGYSVVAKNIVYYQETT